MPTKKRALLCFNLFLFSDYFRCFCVDVLENESNKWATCTNFWLRKPLKETNVTIQPIPELCEKEFS